MKWMMCLLLASGCALAQAPAEGPAVSELKAVPVRGVFEAASARAPLVIKSRDEASAWFEKEELDRLAQAVNFDKQFVLVFAWRGSGGDRLSYTLGESFPEQATFSLEPGRTRDLREHVKVFALRNGVGWTVK